MSLYDVYLLGPVIAMAALALLVVLADLILARKGWTQAIAFVGLLAPAWLAIGQLLVLQFSGFSNLVPGADAASPAGASVLSGVLSIDRFALFFQLLVIVATGLVVLASSDYLRKLERLQGEYFALILVSGAGMMLLPAAVELIAIYLSLELTTLPLAALGAFLLHRQSAEAGLKFLLIGAISSALLLYGMALIFGFTGSTQLPQIAEALREPAQLNVPFGSYAMLVGVALLVVGFGFKLSSVPFQMWVPDVYQGAPAPVVAFLSVGSKAAAFAVLLRVLYLGLPDMAIHWGGLVAALAAASMIVGNLVAMVQSNIRRLLGYSAIAHAGYLLVGVAALVNNSGDVGNAPFATFGPSSVLFYLVAYTAANLAAFFVVIAVSARIEGDLIDDYSGLGRRAPFLAVGFTLALVALIGLPPTGIFIGKFYLFSAAVKSGLVWLAVLGVINSVISAYYYLKVVKVMWLNPPAAPEQARSSPFTRLALAVAGAAIVWLGVAPGAILTAAERAASVLTGVSLR